MSEALLDILYEDNHLLVVNKPPGIATQGAEPGMPSLVNLAKQYLKTEYNKPGNAYIGVVSRLDAVVSGVVVLAKTSKAAERLNEQFRERSVQKIYRALVEGGPRQEHFEFHDWLKPAQTRKGSEVAQPKEMGAVDARLRGCVLRHSAGLALLEIDLKTGRKHQIRVQLASRGWPILGDRLYGSKKSFHPGIALHAHSLAIQHPTTKELLTFDAAVPVAWKPFMNQIGAS